MTSELTVVDQLIQTLLGADTEFFWKSGKAYEQSKDICLSHLSSRAFRSIINSILEVASVLTKIRLNLDRLPGNVLYAFAEACGQFIREFNIEVDMLQIELYVWAGILPPSSVEYTVANMTLLRLRLFVEPWYPRFQDLYIVLKKVKKKNGEIALKNGNSLNVLYTIL